MNPSRRSFIRTMSTGGVGALMVAPLERLYAQSVRGSAPKSPGYGPLVDTLPLNWKELRDTVVGDLSGVPLLALPRGFNYRALSITGQAMGEALVPGSHDGMGCFRGPHRTTILVRNHELSPRSSRFGNREGVPAPDSMKYDAAATGGTTTLVVGPNGKLQSQFPSLAGTYRNCAGGPTPWGSWISCEETVATPETDSRVTKKHGYNFEVPARGGLAQPIPLVAMGRFNHEATATDPQTGYVYQTEDRGDSAFYRYRPNRHGDLRSGGVLEALVIDDARLPQNSSTGAVDTRRNVLSFKNEELAVSWVVIEDVDPDDDTVRDEAHAKKAAIFRRGEGAWYGHGRVYFVASSGGDRRDGQVWAYNPELNTIALVVESTEPNELDHPDNITVAPDGALYLCEDSGTVEEVVGVDREGRLFKFARNVILRPDRNNNPDTGEFAGACFSPDGKLFFVNNQSIGITFCIWGPWSSLGRR